MKTDVLIVGAGPVGLLLACRLSQLGISFKIIDKRTQTAQHSRAVGIHPPSVELFETLGIHETFLDKAVRVPAGKAFANTQELGTLSFKHCPKPYTFVLTLAQCETEAILERELIKRAPDSLLRGLEVSHIEQKEDGVELSCREVSTESLEGKEQRFTADYLVACDGKDSVIRQQLGIVFTGEAYPDTYIMGDFADNTKLENHAGIYLTDEGLIESFPLPNKQRRWVVKTDNYLAKPSKEDLAHLVQERLEHDLPLSTNTMLSSFGVQHFLVERFTSKRVLLAGDAAHVLSPIGGQGMNLGWLDAWDVAITLEAIFKTPEDSDSLLKAYDKKRKKAAKIAIRRAAFNMQLGRKTKFPRLKYAFVKLMLNTALERVFANIFTMRWL